MSESAAVSGSASPAISVRDLVKVYGAGTRNEKRALNGIALDIPRGSFFGLLGPNGAGKSTLINILAGLVNKTSGHAAIWGCDIDTDPRRARAAIGVVPQELNLDPFFTPREAMEFQAGLYGVPKAERRTDEILAAVGLSDKANAYARTLSGGMRRRLLVAKALVHNPPVLVLDEPTAGVDIELRQQLWAYVRELNRAGTTVVLTTHYLEEAEALCDHIAIINHGNVVAHDATPKLLSRLDRKDVIVTLDADLAAVPAALAELNAELLGPRRLRLHYRPSQQPFSTVLARIQQAGLAIHDLSTQEADLEDLFLELTRSRAA
ncbi:MAG: ABC transporter ATP-binding protein [Ferrovibrio sp.]|uniref:ABC transporter ATP-binding protein n=1 Tax=Ferrovibrio sp. TaxID=1917215 RepID=UPI00391C43AE